MADISSSVGTAGVGPVERYLRPIAPPAYNPRRCSLSRLPLRPDSLARPDLALLLA